jgi:hypothetical protein
MKPFVWLGKALADDKGVPSTSRLAFLVFVLAGFAWLSYDLVMSMLTLKKSAISEQWVLAFGIYAGACTSGYVGAKIATRPPPTPPGTP